MAESESSWISTILQARRVAPRQRLVLSLVFGLVAGWMTLHENVRTIGHRDFGQVWFAARAVLHGADPYPLIGIGRAFSWPWHFLFSLPASIATIQLASFSAYVVTVI